MDAEARLSRAPHPASIGSALTHPYLTTDYSEALLEFVTPAYPTNWEVLQFLCDLHCFVQEEIGSDMLWAQSMPCVIPEDHEIPIALYGTSNVGRLKTIYRQGLGYRYGRAMQAIAGLHFNYSLPLGFWESYREREESRLPLQAFISNEYMALVRNYRRYAWLVIYLTGSSPALCKTFAAQPHPILEDLGSHTWFAPYGTSLRMSDIGYRNESQAELQISANSLEEYIDGLAVALKTSNPRYEDIGVKVDGEYRQLNTNVLQIENEYYSPIRPKPRAGGVDRPIAALRKGGVEYVEIRTLDLNMMDPVGVNQWQLRFLEAMLIFCLLEESPPIDAVEQREIDERDLLVAREGRRPGMTLPRGGDEVCLEEWAREVLGPISEIAEMLDGGGEAEGYADAADFALEAVVNSELTPSGQILDHLRKGGDTFLDFALEASRAHRAYFLSLELTPEKRELMSRWATDSLDRQRELEAAAEPDFDDFLQGYVGNV